MTQHAPDPALLTHALAYAARGWPVFPCHTPTDQGCSCRRDCGRIGKHPRTLHGLKDATCDEATIRKWWDAWPQANIALATGAASGLIVLDEDTYKGGDISRIALEKTHGLLPDTIQQLTGGGGVQFFFAHPGIPIRNGVETLGTGLDVRGDGGYVIVPPSKHASGTQYAWELSHDWEDVMLAPMPQWLMTLCQHRTHKEPVDAAAPIPSGRRNATLFQTGCALRARGLSEAAIFGALDAMNATQCFPPLDAEEVSIIAASCAAYPAGASQPSRALPAIPDMSTGGPSPNGLKSQSYTSAPGVTINPPTAMPIIVTLQDVQPEATTWLWWPYLAQGTLAMLDGDPGIGKSLLMTQLAASLSRGFPLPDQQGGPTLQIAGPQSTLLLSTEDSLAQTLRPRLDASGADCARIHVLVGWATAEGGDTQAFTLQHMPILEQAMVILTPRLVVIDPIQAYLGSKMDMHRSNETRPLLAKLTALAEKFDAAIVCIRHPAKPGQGMGKAIHRGLGSIDFIGAARTGLFIEQHPANPGMAILAQSKSNIGHLGRTQLFTKYEGQFQWAGVSRITAELLAGGSRGADPVAFLEAFCWLETRLEGGLSWAATDIEDEGIREGHKKDTLRRAKKTLGVVSQKDGEGWTWRLAPLTILPPPMTGAHARGMSVPSISSLTSNSSETSVSSAILSSSATDGQGTARKEDTEGRQDTEDTAGTLACAPEVIFYGRAPDTIYFGRAREGAPSDDYEEGVI